jgi:hypothetical protein
MFTDDESRLAHHAHRSCPGRASSAFRFELNPGGEVAGFTDHVVKYTDANAGTDTFVMGCLSTLAMSPTDKTRRSWRRV